MVDRAAEALRNCNKPNCCRKLHDIREDVWVNQYSRRVVEFLDSSKADRGEERGNQSSQLYTQHPRRNLRLFDFQSVSPVTEAGLSWQTSVPISQRVLELDNPERLGQLTPENRKKVQDSINEAKRVQRLQTQKIADCPYR